MKLAATQQLYTYWDALRGERVSPERGEIDPTAVRGVLADTFILDVDGARTFPFRLSGTRLNALFGGELKARPFLDLWHPAQRGDIARIVCGVCDEATAVVAGVSAAPRGCETIILELLLLPVRHLGRTHARMLGCLVPKALPAWLGRVAPQHLSILGWRNLPTAAQHGRDGQFPPALTRPADLPSPVAAERRAHLLVYEGENQFGINSAEQNDHNGLLRDRP